MRIFRFASVALLWVLVGSAALLCAQEERPPENKPTEEAKPLPKQPQKQEEKQEKKQDEKPSHAQAMPGHQDHPGPGAAHEQGNMEHPERPQAAPGKGGHIPDQDFHAHFGRGHTFTAQTVIVAARPQFHYGGYSFELVNPWPAGWAYSDDCYIDFIDGQYYLIDLAHPGIQIELIVLL
jgi:hypothetical protein